MAKEEGYKLTERGEKEAIDLLGGQDIANVTACLTALLVKAGNILGGEVTDDVGTWSEQAQIAKALKFLLVERWSDFVTAAEILLTQMKPDYFRTFPHASEGWPDG